jgi:hypothetical protein
MDKAQTQHPEAKPYGEYRDLLGQSGIDAVLIAGPDHHHAPMLYASLKANKDVYLEKPLSTSLQQSLDMIKAARPTDHVVRSAAPFHRQDPPGEANPRCSRDWALAALPLRWLRRRPWNTWWAASRSQQTSPSWWGISAAGAIASGPWRI